MEKKEWNLIYNIGNAFLAHKFPVQLTYFVTERCNAKCPHCFVNTNEKEINNELSLEEIEKISSTSGKSLINVALTGGEPFLRNDIFEIAEIWYKNSTTKSITICTNGSMPDKIEQFVEQAKKINLPASFFFSYDFIGEKHSEYRRINDLHSKVLESYKIVKKYSKDFNATFNITISESNYAEAYKTYEYMRDVLEIKNINCTLVRGSKSNNLSLEGKKQIAKVYKSIQQSINDDFNNGLISGYTNKSLISTALNAKNKMIWKYVLKTFEQNKYISPCCAGGLFGVILSNGDVYPCELLSKKIDNLKEFDYNFIALWESDQTRKIVKNIKSSKCFCTFECTWLLNIFSSPRYYAEILYHIINNSTKHRNYITNE